MNAQNGIVYCWSTTRILRPQANFCLGKSPATGKRRIHALASNSSRRSRGQLKEWRQMSWWCGKMHDIASQILNLNMTLVLFPTQQSSKRSSCLHTFTGKKPFLIRCTFSLKVKTIHRFCLQPVNYRPVKPSHTQISLSFSLCTRVHSFPFFTDFLVA